MVNINLEQGGSITTMLSVAGLAILLAGIFYWRAFRTLRAYQWQLLLGLRIVAIAIVVLLLFRPVFSYHLDLKRKPVLVFLVDRSASMSIADDASGLSRFALARQQLERWWQRLGDDFELHLVEFAERPRPLESVEQLEGSAPDGKATSLSRALLSAEEQASRKDLEGVILLSDGIDNSARRPLEVAERMGVPVHTVAVGASLRNSVTYRDIQVTAVDCPDRLLLNNKAKITASIEGIGLSGYVTKVVLEDEGQPIEDVDLTLDDVEGAQKVTFEFVPAVKGRHNFTVRVPPASEEKVVENNDRKIVALVVEPGMRVLYIEGTLRAEYGALVDRFLSKDPDLEFCALVQTRPNVFLKRSNIAGLEMSAIPNDPETIARFDVFIFGDLDSTYIRPQQQELIVKRVQEGGGLIMLGGYHSLGPGGYAGTPLGNILPVELGDREIGQITENFLPVLTPEGTHHPMFSNVVDFFPTRQGEPKVIGLPPLDGCTRVQNVRPTATVLATCMSAGGEVPVIAAQPQGKGRTAVFTGDTTRKWQQGPRAMGQDTPFLQFWGQVVRWLAGRSTAVENQASISASADKAYYQPDEPIRIAAVVRDEKGEGSGEAAVEAKIVGPGGRPDKVALSVAPGGEGHYGGTFEPRDAGSYTIAVEGQISRTRLSAEPIVVDVGRPQLEFEKLDVDEELLAKIATATGGRSMHISTADHLVDQLDKTQRKKALYMERRLYHPAGFWALFLVVLTCEWVLRRRYQLR